MKNFLLFIICLISFQITSAQYSERIGSARPGQAIGPHTVGKSVFQHQTGFTFQRQLLDGAQYRNDYQHTNIFRIGIIEKLELSAVLNWLVLQNPKRLRVVSGPHNYEIGISNTQLGLRYNILQQDGAKPGLGIQGRVLFKAQSPRFRSRKMGYNFIASFSTSPISWWSLTTNIGVANYGSTEKPFVNYVFNSSFKIVQDFGCFIELYGNFNDPTISYDGGIYYLIGDNVKLDASAGHYPPQTFARKYQFWFVDVGLSWRVDWRKSEKNTETDSND